MHDQITWVLAACAQVMRPLLRLALSLGVKHAQLDRLLRDLLLEEGRALLHAQGSTKPNISQLATTTGLNRKEVTARVRNGDSSPRPSTLPPTALVFTQWLQLAEGDAKLRSLPISAPPELPSFEALARQATRGNLHHRSVLDDLVRLGMVTEQDDRVELAATGFVPAKDVETLLSFLGSNAGDHLQAAVHNTLGQVPAMLERTVYAHGLTVEECERLQSLTRQRWESLHHPLVDDLTKGIAQSGPDGGQRIKIGIYVYHEAMTPPRESSSTPIPPASEKP